MSTPDGRRSRGEETRRRLLQAAVRIAGRDGPAAVTHRAVAAEAGLTKSLATYHFASIDDLLTAALAENMAEYAAEVAAALPPDCDVTEFAEYLATTYNATRDLWLAYYELYLFAARRPSLRPAVLLWTDWTTEMARRYTSDPVGISIFVAAIDGLGLQTLVHDEPLDPDHLKAVLTRAVES